jgi:beta-xylosidase
VLLLATEDWEAHDVEGPFVWEEPGQPFLYLFYSGSNTWGDTYAVGVARARSINGPWAKLGAPVIHTRVQPYHSPANRTLPSNLTRSPTSARSLTNTTSTIVNTTFVSPGHNSVARKDGKTYLVYHAERWNETGVGSKRYTMVDRLEWGPDNWPRLATKDGAPSDTQQLVP